jgi:hypothetical protein
MRGLVNTGKIDRREPGSGGIVEAHYGEIFGHAHAGGTSFDQERYGIEIAPAEHGCCEAVSATFDL